MKVSQLQLRFYTLTKVHVEPREPTGLALPEGVLFSDWDGVNISSTVEFAWADGQGDDPRNFALRLGIAMTNETEKKAPYSIDVGCIGYFDLMGDLSRLHRLDFGQVNGASILYGILREFVFATTSRFALGGLVLPSVTFLDLRTESARTPESQPGTGATEQGKNVPVAP